MNPYVYDRPLARREQFYGRRSEIMRIYSRIAADRPQSVSIVGERRIGKTSLLNWLFHGDSRADYIDDPAKYVYLLLPLNEQPPERPEAFFARMSKALQQTDQGTMIPSYEGFAHFVERLMEEGRKLVLFCDDFGLVTQNRAFPLEFFSFLRSMANNHDLAYVTTSFAELQKLCASQALEESPFFNIFTTVTLRSFSEEEARSLIQEPAGAAGAPFEEQVANWVLECAGPLPYLLQVVASLAFEAHVKGTLGKSEVAEKAFREAQAFLNLLWEESFSPVEQEVLQRICHGHKVELRNRYAAEELERRGYLKRVEEEYVLRSALVRRFVTESKGGGIWRRLFRGGRG